MTYQQISTLYWRRPNNKKFHILAILKVPLKCLQHLLRILTKWPRKLMSSWLWLRLPIAAVPTTKWPRACQFSIQCFKIYSFISIYTSSSVLAGNKKSTRRRFVTGSRRFASSQAVCLWMITKTLTGDVLPILDNTSHLLSKCWHTWLKSEIAMSSNNLTMDLPKKTSLIMGKQSHQWLDCKTFLLMYQFQWSFADRMITLRQWTRWGPSVKSAKPLSATEKMSIAITVALTLARICPTFKTRLIVLTKSINGQCLHRSMKL